MKCVKRRKRCAATRLARSKLRAEHLRQMQNVQKHGRERWKEVYSGGKDFYGETHAVINVFGL